MRIASHVRLEPETVLRPITILAQRDVVRMAEGTVMSSTVELHPHGREIYPCTVRLRRLSAHVPDDHPADRHDIDDPARVRATLWALADLSYPVALTSGTQRVQGRLVPVKGNRDKLPELRCLVAADVPLAGAVQLECTLYGSGYRFFARVRRYEQGLLVLQPAPVVREWHRRDEERFTLPDGIEGWVDFEHPLLGLRQRRRLVDISVHGFGCVREPDDETLWPGLPLGRVKVTLPNLAITAEATVKNVTAERSGAQLSSMSEQEIDRLRVEITKMAVRPIELLVENAALRLRDPVCARALGLRRGELRVNETRRAFAKVGIVRSREAWGAFRAGRCQAILVQELASPGLALSSVLSSAMLLLTTAQPNDADVMALASLARARPLPGDPPVRFIFVPQPFDDRALVAAGFRRAAGCTLYAMHRFGLSEYQRFVSTRYGFLHGRLRARVAGLSSEAA